MCFFLFDHLLLLKRGGESVFVGELGEKCHKLVDYLEAIPGTPPCPKDQNPASWMLEVIGAGVSSTSSSTTDFVKCFQESEEKRILDVQLDRPGVTQPSPDLPEMIFEKKRAANSYTPMRFLVKRFNDRYWRTPTYNITRFAIALGTLPISFAERGAYYRERASQTYNCLWYFVGSTVAEIPYVFSSTALFTIIVYPSVGFRDVASGFMFWIANSLFVLMQAYLGQLFIYAMPTVEVVAIVDMLYSSICLIFAVFNHPAANVPRGFHWLTHTHTKIRHRSPDAHYQRYFSIDVVYSIMTKGEFAAKIMNSFAKGNTTTRGVPSDENKANPVTATSAASATRKPYQVSSTGYPQKHSVARRTTALAHASNEAATAGTVDWTKSACMSPIQNQGQCGDCWAFASAAAIESAQSIAGGRRSLHKYSEQQLVSCNKQNRGCNSGAPQYAFDYILKNGVCSEAAFPYASGQGRIPSCGRCTRTQPGIKGYTVLNVGDEAGLIKAINQRPTVVTVAAGNVAWKQYTGGVLSGCDTSALDHLVVAVGYDQ
ncbi:ABC transporter [Phytophthora cinnamomi]|uniref:ABC transporter n=1 Tax=Phytophthora cinnamomi TaxID=4785 RepID=UPI00355A125F|nr:ABC transporter [Phytophthora cinnamomi]